MMLSRVSLFNVGLIQSLTIDCAPKNGAAGSVVIVRGANGTGKTTILNSLAAIMEGGQNPALIGPAADHYVIEVEFDNGERYRREERRNPDGSGDYAVRGWYAHGGTIKGAPTRLKKLMADVTAFSPTGLVDADPKERVKFLQAAMPLTFTGAEVAEAMGADVASTRLPRVLDLASFTSVRDGQYERRREVNVRVAQLRSTRKTFAESLPEGDFLRFARTGSSDTQPELVATAEADRIRGELEAARGNLTAALQGFRSDYDSIVKQTHADELAEIEAVRKRWNDQRTEIHSRYEGLVTVERKPYDAEVERLAGELAAAEERASAEKRLQGVREAIAQLDEEIEAKDSEAQALDSAVQKLDALKQRKLDSQPIPGVEIRAGRIYYNGLDFDTQLNTAQQYLISFQVAALTRSGDEDLKLMLFDNAEALDGDNRAAFVEGIKAAGYQVVMAEVATGEPLAVETV